MLRKSCKSILVTVMTISFLLGVVFIPAGDMAFAYRDTPRHHERGTVVRRLPPGHRTVWHGRSRYYYDRGVFYNRGPSGFVVINAPIGAVLLSIPIGSRAVLVGGLTYYLYSDVYYRRVGTGYIVVEPPAQTVVVKEVSAVKPSEEKMGETVLVSVPLLNVRSGPGANFPVVQEAREGDLFTVHGYAPEWLYVKLSTGEFGWVMLRYTSPPASPASG
ncbi:MAG: DUF6515 family protein [Desulfobacterales bacterium]|nr:DUF6515 family protein [Desulfobacterales bacterium]